MEPAGCDDDFDLVVAGGGAAGFFAAITFAEARPGSRVVILEKSREVLGKVRISGGGRCNVTHACFEPKVLVTHYPRGSRQLIGPFHRWSPTDTMEWFESRGVPLKTESDGRVFPQSDSSQAIIDCLSESARTAGVEVRCSTAVKEVSRSDHGSYEVQTSSGASITTRKLLLTLGGTRNRFGADLAAHFGHRIEVAAPSLFTFRIQDDRLDELQGLSVASARVRIPGTKLVSTGPVLVTHWGLSGPGILKISAWGARELQQRDYRFEVEVNWTGELGEEAILEEFARLRVESPRRKVVNDAQFGIPGRLWKRLVGAAAAGEADALHWPHLAKAVARRLAAQLGACRFRVDGKSMNKDEFVTCGGVHLGDVNFKTMESRKVGGLHFAGEILDIDGITGGFNFQAAWTTARIAGEAIADSF
ncbi:NAD(P)/FAD-dependent oxidoreductase [Haloferula sp. A504]|uniref:NAD(P)/FAD-dependent oxidoreductase n=1 Tax=Haloferula sp. A504 TaxID=3373601 RepID=UPI0031C15F60|nr:NAD(P)/FAD-dependent oxidoreductase [Verrucomicrobiaceae bacterium E54]